MERLSSHLFVFLLTIGLAIMLKATQAPFDASEIDQFVAEQMATHNLHGLALAITRGDVVLYTQGFGSARADRPVTPQTQFFIASLSKSFTALAIMQLVEAGKIDLDAPVQRYIPEFTLADPTLASQITIRHLLNQTSGLTDAGYAEGRLPQPATFAQRISSMSSARPVASPGTEYHYFNPNYQLLARVVDVTSGEPFSAYLQTHIFAPLQMEHTFSASTTADALRQVDNVAEGHLMAFGLAIATQEMQGFIGGSGGVVSTAADMANYLIMHNSEGRFAAASLLSPANVELMHTAPSTLNSDYAMGWLETSDSGRRILEHDGVLSAFYADIVLLPETGDGLVILYNASSFASNSLAAPRIKKGLIAILTGEQPTTGGLSVRWVGAIIALCTLVGVGLATNSLLRLPRWRQKAKTRPMWRLLLGIVGALLPALILLGFPYLITNTTGRAFSYAQLARSMPDIFIWLGLNTLLGAANAMIRVLLLSRGVHHTE